MAGFIIRWLYTCNYTYTLAIQHYLSCTQFTVYHCGLLPPWTSRGCLLPRTCSETDFILNCMRNPPRTTYRLHADRTENSVVLLVSTDCTENISRGCYRCVATHCCRDVFTSALHSNKRGAATLSTVACVTQQQVVNTRTSIVVCVFRGFCISTVPTWGKYATILNFSFKTSILGSISHI
jgi:hypothetical protein